MRLWLGLGADVLHRTRGQRYKDAMAECSAAEEAGDLQKGKAPPRPPTVPLPVFVASCPWPPFPSRSSPFRPSSPLGFICPVVL